jgi:4-hydroxy-tetrahydrodipicolinate reductase
MLDDRFDIEIVEMHHKHKVDAPSGTAVGLGRAAAAGRGVDLDNVAQWSRAGHTGERGRGDIGFATLRGGDVAGDHSVIFARGAVHAAKWAKDRPPGLYNMFDVLGIEF